MNEPQADSLARIADALEAIRNLLEDLNNTHADSTSDGITITDPTDPGYDPHKDPWRNAPMHLRPDHLKNYQPPGDPA